MNQAVVIRTKGHEIGYVIVVVVAVFVMNVGVRKSANNAGSGKLAIRTFTKTVRC